MMIAEIDLFVVVNGEHKIAHVDLEGPPIFTRAVAEDFVVTTVSAFARLWNVDPDLVQVGLTIVEQSRKVISDGDVYVLEGRMWDPWEWHKLRAARHQALPETKK